VRGLKVVHATDRVGKDVSNADVVWALRDKDLGKAVLASVLIDSRICIAQMAGAEQFIALCADKFPAHSASVVHADCFVGDLSVVIAALAVSGVHCVSPVRGGLCRHLVNYISKETIMRFVQSFLFKAAQHACKLVLSNTFRFGVGQINPTVAFFLVA
jgi:hypothetical protein